MRQGVLAGFGQEVKINTKIKAFWVVRPDHSELTSNWRLGRDLKHKACRDFPYTHRSRHAASRSCKYSVKAENCVTQVTAMAKYHKPYSQMDDPLGSQQDYKGEGRGILG